MEKNKENETEVLEKEYMDNNCNDVMNMYNKTCNKFLLKKELLALEIMNSLGIAFVRSIGCILSMTVTKANMLIILSGILFRMDSS